MIIQQDLLQCGARLMSIAWPDGKHAWDILVHEDGTLNLRCVENTAGRRVGVAIKQDAGNALTLSMRTAN